MLIENLKQNKSKMISTINEKIQILFCNIFIFISFYSLYLRAYVSSLLTKLCFFSFVVAFCWHGDYFRINNILLLEKLVPLQDIVFITILVCQFYGILSVNTYIYTPIPRFALRDKVTLRLLKLLF